MKSMNPDQKRAFEIWLESADFESDFKTISLPKLAERLKAEGIQTSTSALGRWKLKFGWDDALEAKVTAATVKDGPAKEIIEKSSLQASTQKILDDFEANEKLKSDSYDLLQLQMVHYREKIKTGKKFSKDEERFLLKVLEITSNREDKLLDRQALLAATKLTSSEEVLAKLQEEVIDLEFEE